MKTLDQLCEERTVNQLRKSRRNRVDRMEFFMCDEGDLETFKRELDVRVAALDGAPKTQAPEPTIKYMATV